MLLSRVALPLSFLALGGLSSTIVSTLSSASEQLDDSKAFASVVERVPSDAPIASKAVVPEPGKGIVLRRSDDGLFYARASVNGISVRFVVDTGSSMVVLTQGDALRLGVSASTSERREMQTAGGTVSITSASLDRVHLGGRSVRHVDAVVVADGLPTSLMGQNLLSRLGPITIDGDQLTL